MLDQWKLLCDAKRDPSRTLVWFHAPSVGEGLQARPIIDLLRAQHPEMQIAYSFFSPSAEKFANSLNVDMAEYLPFDSAGAAERLITLLSPSALFFSKLDVWPNLVRVAHKRGVTTGLLSATLAPGSGRQGALARMTLGDAYRTLDVVGAIDKENAERLLQLGVQHDRMHITGDTRFDQVWARAQTVDRSSALITSLQSSRPTLVAGSTWPADEAVLLPSWAACKKVRPELRLIIAPHEPTREHLAPIESWARDNSLNAIALSKLVPADADLREVAVDSSTSTSARAASTDCDVIVVDRVGVLGSIYAVGSAAFVGGGFHNAGLHSVIEPAAFGLPVLFGPQFHNSREAELLNTNGAAFSVTNQSSCEGMLRVIFGDSPEMQHARTRARSLVESERGASERSVDLVLRALHN